MSDFALWVKGKLTPTEYQILLNHTQPCHPNGRFCALNARLAMERYQITEWGLRIIINKLNDYADEFEMDVMLGLIE